MGMLSEELQELISFSRLIGKDPGLVQAGGGNTSVKTSQGFMYIKESGVPLANVSRNNFLKIKYLEARHLFKGPKATGIKIIGVRNSDRQVSMEVFMHTLLNKYVVHLHPVYVNALTCMQNGQRVASKIFLRSLDYVWLEYYPPGRVLAKALQRVIDKNHSTPCVIFLSNHGIVLSGVNLTEIKTRLKFITRKLEDYFGKVRTKGTRMQKLNFPKIEKLFLLKIYKIRSSLISRVLSSSVGNGPFLKKVLYPDMAVYCGEKPLCLNNKLSDEGLYREVKLFLNKYGYFPKVIISKDSEILLLGRSIAECFAIAEILKAYLKTKALILKKGKPKFLKRKEVLRLISSRAEKNRGNYYIS